MLDRRQLVLEAGQDDRWLVSDLEAEAADEIDMAFNSAREQVKGLQFIAIQTTPEQQSFAGFWMMRDVPMP